MFKKKEKVVCNKDIVNQLREIVIPNVSDVGDKAVVVKAKIEELFSQIK